MYKLGYIAHVFTRKIGIHHAGIVNSLHVSCTGLSCIIGRFTVALLVADLEGDRTDPLPPPLGDGLTPSLTVMLANAKF